MPKSEKFDKITQDRKHIGDSQSGKATDSDSVIRVFESLIPSQTNSHSSEWFFVWVRGKNKNPDILRVGGLGGKQIKII